MPKKVKLIFLGSIIMGTLGIFGLAASWYFLWNNKLSPILEQNKKLDDDLSQINNKINQIPMLLAKLSQLRAKETALKNLIPSADYKSMEKFIETVRKYAYQNGLKIRDIKEESLRTVSTTLPPDVENITIEFELSGNYIQVIKFIDQTEHSIRYFAIENFEFSQGTKEPEISIKLTGYIDTAREKIPQNKFSQDHEKTTELPR